MKRDLLKEIVQELNRSDYKVNIAIKDTYETVMTIYFKYVKVTRYIVKDNATGRHDLRKHVELLDIDSEVIATIKEENIKGYRFNLDNEMVIYINDKEK